MRLSRNIQYRHVQAGVVGVYSPFGQEVAFVAARYWDALESGMPSLVPGVVLDDLVRRGFLVEADQETRMLQAISPPPAQLSELWLVLTDDCNLACRYCVVDGNIGDRAVSAKPSDTTPRALMSPATADAAVRCFFAHCHAHGTPPSRIVFYGGEPLLNGAAIRSAVPLIRELEARLFPLARPVSIVVITNGVAYDDALTDVLKFWRVSVSVSLDGMKHHHDLVRRTRGGAPTFDRAVAGLRRYQAAGLNTGICTTIGTHNVDDLPAIADYLADEFGVHMQFQVPYDVPLPAGNPFYVSMKEAAPRTLEAYERLRRRGLVEGLTERRVSLFARGIFHHRDCYAVGGQWVVSPDGRVGPCHSLVGNPRYFAGDIHRPGESPFELPVFQEWSRRMPVNMPECLGCAGIALCGGGCPYNALVKRGSIWARDPQQCDYMRLLIDWLIQDVWRHRTESGSSASATSGRQPAPDMCATTGSAQSLEVKAAAGQGGSDSQTPGCGACEGV